MRYAAIVMMAMLAVGAMADDSETAFGVEQTISVTPPSIRLVLENGVYFSAQKQWEWTVEAYQDDTIQVPVVAYDTNGVAVATNMVDKVVRTVMPVKENGLMVRRRPMVATMAQVEAKVALAPVAWTFHKKLQKALLEISKDQLGQ